MNIVPEQLHQRAPVFLGSKAEVAVATGYHLRHDRPGDADEVAAKRAACA